MGLRVCVCVCAQGPRKRALCSGAAARRACANQCIRAGGVAHGLDKALTSCPLPAYPSSPPRTPPPRCIARSPPTACVPAARPRLRAAMATRAVASSRLPFTSAKLRPCPFFEIPNLRASQLAVIMAAAAGWVWEGSPSRKSGGAADVRCACAGVMHPSLCAPLESALVMARAHTAAAGCDTCEYA